MDRGEVYYRIVPQNDEVDFQKVSQDDLYDSRGRGFIRKAMVGPQRNRSSIASKRKDKKFKDEYFTLEKSRDYFLTRVSDLYDFNQGSLRLFPDDESSSIIEQNNSICSFLCECGLINYNYLRTLFITQKVNKEGRYEYFIKRDGEYVIEECDDIIPVDRRTWKPLWGLSYKYPWQLILLKAWIKQCGGWSEMMNAEPFQFIDAFGLPEYKVFNFRKQMRFLKNERVPMEQKSQKIKYSPLNNEHIMLIAATSKDRNVQRMGLIPNKAGYRVFPIVAQEENRDNQQVQYIYRVQTNLPCNWVGKLTAVTRTQVNQRFDQHQYFNLQTTFLMTEEEVLECFNKFYAAPEQFSFTNSFTSQDCIECNLDGENPIWIAFDVDGKEDVAGSCGISMQLPKKKYNNSYPDFRYFLAKKNSEIQINRSHFRGDVRGSERQGNLFAASSCDKWEQYAIDYLQGFHHSACCFPKIVPGSYVLYINSNQQTPMRIRFDAQVSIKSKPTIIQVDQQQRKNIFDSIFFSIGADQGTQTSFTKQSFQQSINLNDAFEELGFASVCIKTLKNAKHKVAMKIHTQKLKNYGIRVLGEYQKLIRQGEKGGQIVLVSEKGTPEIIVMEKIKNRKQRSLGNKFPPEGTFEFFKVFEK